MDKKYLNNERTQELINMIKEQYLSKNEIPYMASRIQTNVVTHSINGNSSVRAKVDFTRPFSDDNYITIWESDKLQIECAITEKTNEGFVAVISNYNSSDLDVTAKFTSFKLFEMTTIDDLETKYSDCIRIVSELSSDMVGLKDKTVVLYRGDDTYTYSPTTLSATDNPSELGVYESDGTEYILSTDTAYDSAKTYYTREIEYKSFGTYQYDETEDKWILKSAKNDDAQIVLDDELDEESENAVKNRVIATEVNKRLTVTDTMPTASADLLGQTRLYIGSTTTNYQEGGIYKCESDGQTPPTYAWNIKNKADIDLSLYKKIFTGTQATWNTLTDVQKKEYDIANITDDTEDSVVDEVADGDMRAVTSNAVYDVLSDDTESTSIVKRNFGGMVYLRIPSTVSCASVFSAIIGNKILKVGGGSSGTYVIGYYGTNPIDSISFVSGTMKLFGGSTAVKSFQYNGSDAIGKTVTLIGVVYTE